MKMNRKGQVTVPAGLRAELDWRPGDRFVWSSEFGKVYLRRVTAAEGDTGRAVRRESSDRRRTADELMAMLCTD